jgi:hypothetical protein
MPGKSTALFGFLEGDTDRPQLAAQQVTSLARFEIERALFEM